MGSRHSFVYHGRRIRSPWAAKLANKGEEGHSRVRRQAGIRLETWAMRLSPNWGWIRTYCNPQVWRDSCCGHPLFRDPGRSISGFRRSDTLSTLVHVTPPGLIGYYDETRVRNAGRAGQGKYSSKSAPTAIHGNDNDLGMKVRPPLGTVSNARVSRTNTV